MVILNVAVNASEVLQERGDKRLARVHGAGSERATLGELAIFLHGNDPLQRLCPYY